MTLTALQVRRTMKTSLLRLALLTAWWASIVASVAFLGSGSVRRQADLSARFSKGSSPEFIEISVREDFGYRRFIEIRQFG